MLKNTVDWVYPEWNRKAAAFVSYGSAAGARGVQQLRETAIELELAPVRSSVYIPTAILWGHFQGGDVDAGLAELAESAATLIDDLLWWSATLKMARAAICGLGFHLTRASALSRPIASGTSVRARAV